MTFFVKVKNGNDGNTVFKVHYTTKVPSPMYYYESFDIFTLRKWLVECISKQVRVSDIFICQTKREKYNWVICVKLSEGCLEVPAPFISVSD